MGIKENSSIKIKKNLRYLQLLSTQYPTISSASTEIINLQAIINLPKGTEHFITDLHGEYESFLHVLKNGSGVLRRKIDEIFGNTLRIEDKKSLATLIYYPEQKLELISKKEKNVNDWYKITLYRLIEICRVAASKYTRSKVRKALPKDFSYIIEELLHEQNHILDKQAYYDEIIKTIIRIDRAPEFIVAISKLIQRLVIDRLHIIGDIFDRGPGAHIILDTLMNYHSIDIQWGNHDILWMGAAGGSELCIINVLRISTRYANLATLEDGYGINLLPLATFALELYKDDPCFQFKPKIERNISATEKDLSLISKMHKAISILQFKLEGEIIRRRPELNMGNRLLLQNIDYANGTINLDGKEYKLLDTNFPTIDPKDPYRLTKEEKELIAKLTHSFLNSEKLQNHIKFLLSKGSLYLKYNSNLLFHGCIPLDEEGGFKSIRIEDKSYEGKALLDKYESIIRKAFLEGTSDAQRQKYLDYIWYLWTGPDSPLFGKDVMRTFERYFIENKEAHKEKRNSYYTHWDNEDVICSILKEFGLDPNNSHIVNGHIPVEAKNGESPIKANGKLFVIDGGFCTPYQKKTGIAGYTLIYNSFGLILATHQHFESTQKAIEDETDIVSASVILEKVNKRQTVGDTDIGAEIKQQINDLEQLLGAYRSGIIKEKF